MDIDKDVADDRVLNVLDEFNKNVFQNKEDFLTHSSLRFQMKVELFYSICLILGGLWEFY